jgi:cell division protein FtsQ
MDYFAVFKKTGSLRFLLVFICLATIIWVLALRWQQSRNISRVNVVGTSLLRQQEILDLVKLPESRAVRDVNTAEIERRIQKHPFIKSVSVFLGASDALTITVEERKPIAMVVNKGKQSYIDAEGRLLPYRLTETVLDLPILSGLGRGSLDSAKIAMVIATMTTLQQQDGRLYRTLSEIDVLPTGEMTLHFTESPIPIRFGNSEDKEQKIARISAFLHHTGQGHDKLKQIAIAYVDVRWQNQVVVHPSN